MLTTLVAKGSSHHRLLLSQIGLARVARHLDCTPLGSPGSSLGAPSALVLLDAPSLPQMSGTSLTMHRCAHFKAAGIAQRPQTLRQQWAAQAAPRRTVSVVAHIQQEEHQPFRSAAAAVAAFGAASLLLLASGVPPASAAGGRLPPVTESADRCASWQADTVCVHAAPTRHCPAASQHRGTSFCR